MQVEPDFLQPPTTNSNSCPETSHSFSNAGFRKQIFGFETRDFHGPQIPPKLSSLVTSPLYQTWQRFRVQGLRSIPGAVPAWENSAEANLKNETEAAFLLLLILLRESGLWGITGSYEQITSNAHTIYLQQSWAPDLYQNSASPGRWRGTSPQEAISGGPACEGTRVPAWRLKRTPREKSRRVSTEERF